ncbi:MAG: HAMP domain-containing protein [Candidatus Competibacter sp.]|nr:HAMP domain-containing protein [Candidatus Competibacter sp.]
MRATTWIASSLHRKFAAASASGLLAVSLLFLLVFVGLYRSQINDERARLAGEVNRLLQAALENAMLKRDLDGLRQIVDRLGQQEAIRLVMILNPEGVVRFSSDPRRIGEALAGHGDPTCPACLQPADLSRESVLSLVDENQRNVLRSVHPVHNKPACAQCHGPVETHPVNGVLVVDHETETVRARVLHSTQLLMGSGAVVVLFAVLGGWWFIRRWVLNPVSDLASGAAELASGRLEARVPVTARDEIGGLANTFNRMAEHLARSLTAVKEQEALLQNVLDAIPDGIRLIGRDYKILQANKTYCQQLGYSTAEVMGVACHRSSHQRAMPCPLTLIACPLVEIEKTGQPVKVIQQFTRRDGSSYYVEIYGAPLRATIGGQEQALIVESIRDLAKQVEYSHEQKLATLAQLAAGVAHEIRNPLASIRIALDALFRVRDNAAQEGETLYEYLHLVNRQMDKCIDITERLLRLSALPGQSPELVSINQAIEETTSLMQLEASQRNVRIELLLEPVDVRVMASESEIRIVVINMVQNAFHAIEGGGSIKVSSHADGERVEMRFEDTGIGIRPDYLPYIFDPFFSRRADGARGTGLGLSICRAIVEHWGGGIQVFSRLGEGTQFIVAFPNADTSVLESDFE